MKRIYITAIPLDSNFAITPYAADSVNYTQTAAQPTCYPITPILADTAHPGDEIKIITVRQVNTPHSENLEVFRREVDGLGFPYTLVDLTTPENQQRDGLLALFEALTDVMESDACYYMLMRLLAPKPIRLCCPPPCIMPRKFWTTLKSAASITAS